MSQGNVEIVRRLYELTAQGRLSDTLHLYDPEVEYVRILSPEDAGIGLTESAHGVDAMVRAAFEWIQTFDVLRVEAERFVEIGDSVLIFVRHTGTAKVSGLPIDEEFADLMTLRDGRIIRCVQYRDRAQALEAVGLSE